MDTVQMDVRNLELPPDGLFVGPLAPDRGLLDLRLSPKPDCLARVRRLEDRYLGRGTLEGGMRLRPRLRHLRQFGVATATATLLVETARTGDFAWWDLLVRELCSVEHVLSLAQRRNVVFVGFRCRGHRPRVECPERPQRCANWGQPLVHPTGLDAFVAQALLGYARLKATCGGDVVETALLYYLASFRDDLFITERFLDAFLALEILANADASRKDRATRISKCTYGRIRDALAEVVRDPTWGLPPDVVSGLARACERLNDVPITEKILNWLSDQGLASYGDRVREWVRARGGLAHSGVTRALPVDPDDRAADFHGPYVQAVRGCLERCFLQSLYVGPPQLLVSWSDAPGEQVTHELWPPA